MNSSKLVQMLETLSKKEWKSLELMVHSPYFNRQEKCVELFEYIKKALSTGNNQLLEKEKIIEQLFKEHKDGRGYLSVITRYLTRIVEEFFIQEKLQAQSYYRNHLLHSAFLERELFQEYNSSIRKYQRVAIEEGKQVLRKGKKDYFSDYLQAYDENKYNQIAQDRNTETHILELAIEKLDQYYWVHRLAIMIELLSLKEVSKNISSYLKSTELPDISFLFPKDKHELLFIYYTAVLMLKKSEEKIYYLQLEQLLEQYHNSISKTELSNLYTILINHLIRANHRGENHFIKVFQLYQFMATHDILTAEEYISLSKFKNIVTLGCILKEFAWIAHFIEQYKTKLAPQHRESVYAFNMGFLYFFQKQYDLAQDYLLKVDNFDIYYTMDTKSLIIQIYYETGQLQAAQYLLDPFRDFLRKQKKLNPRIKQGYLNFMHMLTSILKAQQKYGDKQALIKKLLAKLDKYQVIHRKEWLKERIETM